MVKFWEIPDISVECTPRLTDADAELRRRIQAALPPGTGLLELRILGKHLDARRKIPQWLYRAAVSVEGNTAVPGACELNAFPPEPELELPRIAVASGTTVVVGTGPAGIFGALALALSGVPVVVVDRGFDVDERARKQAEFLRTRQLDPDSNLLIGEGGAGTFSDGKLYTRVRDARSAWVLKVMSECCKLPELRYLKHPHIGSDNLPLLAKGLRRRIEEQGGSFRFGAEVAGVRTENAACCGVELKSGEFIPAQNVLLAHGLGGRALTLELAERGLAHELKNFQIGVRIQHPQSLIDRRMYHCDPRPAVLSAAEYNLTGSRHGAVKQVSTFCMCPGGQVVMASAWPGELCSNGMSDHSRGGKFANSCLIAAFDGKTFGTARGAYEFLAEVARRAFAAGGGDYTMPGQSATGFLNGATELRYESDSVQTGVVPARLDLLLPGELTSAVKSALREFDRKIPGFISTGQLAGVETCVSSPVRLIRDENCMTACRGLFVAGEGAGYAGGIMSAALDGIRAAEGMLKNYV